MPRLPLAVVSTAGASVGLVANKRRADTIGYLPDQQKHTCTKGDIL